MASTSSTPPLECVGYVQNVQEINNDSFSFDLQGFSPQKRASVEIKKKSCKSEKDQTREGWCGDFYFKEKSDIEDISVDFQPFNYEELWEKQQSYMGGRWHNTRTTQHIHCPKPTLAGAVSAGMGLYEDNYEVDDTQPTSESPGPADAVYQHLVLWFQCFTMCLCCVVKCWGKFSMDQ